jgi:hypothetical protein
MDAKQCNNASGDQGICGSPVCAAILLNIHRGFENFSSGQTVKMAPVLLNSNEHCAPGFVKNRGAWGTQVEDNKRGEGVWWAQMCAVVPSMHRELETIISSSLSLGCRQNNIVCTQRQLLLCVK